MGINEIIKPIKKSLLISIRLSYQSICNHPILLIFSISLLFLYKYFPSLFSFLLSTSPVLICTTLLLGVLLSFGQPNSPQIEEENQITSEIHTRNLQINPNLPQIEPNPIQTPPIQNEPNITERELGVFFSEKGSTTSYPKPEGKDNKNAEKTDILEREIPERENTTIETGDSSFVRAFSLNEISLEDQQIDLGSPQWQRIDRQDRSSDSESDGGESSSPDTSMTDIIPLLDEIDPLLDRNTPITQNPKTHSDDDSLDENSNDDDDEEEEEEERETESERKGDELREPAFSWTADDQKNLMDLGYSELERNQRLENLMARRRSRKNITFDRNLIDLETTSPHRTGSSTGTDDLSRFRVQVAPVSVPRSNPFDFDPDPSVPGSAPSVFNPRRNPFDFTPYEQPSESSVFPRETSFSPREFMNVSHQNTFFKKYDSFNYSSERRFSRMKPYFVPEFGMDGVGSSSRDSAFNAVSDLDAGLDSVIKDPDPLSKEESESDGSDDVNSVDVELDQSEFEANGGRETPLLAFDYLQSLDYEVPLESPVPDLLSWDNEPAEVSLGGVSSSSSETREFEENYEKTTQFRTMDLHSIPEEELTEDPKPDKTDKPEPLNPEPSEPDRDSDEDADRIFPEPMDESLLAELDQVGDFNVLGFQSAVSDEVRVSNGEDPEQTVYNPRRHVLLEASDVGEIDALFGGIREESSNRDLDSRILGESSNVGNENPGIGDPGFGILDINARSFDDIESALMQVTESDDVGLIGETKSGILIVKASSKEGLESVFKQVGGLLGKSSPGYENPGFVEDLDSGMLVLDAKCIDDIDSAFEGIENTGNGDSGIVDETESGMLVMKAKSKEDIESVFKQVGEVLGKSDPGNGSTESGMMILEAKSIDDIDLALLNASENEGNGDSGLVDETDSGLLIMNAKSKEDIESVFKQVGEVLGKSDPGIGITESVGDSDSRIFVLDAKSIEDIDSAMLQVSENTGNGDSGLVDETDSGLLIMKAKSKEDIESIFKQVGEVLGKSNPGNENPGFVEDFDSGILVLDAKSLNDIDSAIMQVSEITESENTGLIDETDSGMLIMKAKSKADIESVFKQVSEVLGKQDAGNENPGFMEDSDSGILVLDAKSIEDIDSAIIRVTENTESENTGLIDETDSGMLIMKAKSKADIESVFKQVSEVLGKSDPVNVNPGVAEDSDSEMLVLDAKSINDIDSALLHMNEDQENDFDETENGMLVLKAKSVSEIESVFKQVGQVLGKQNPGNENPGFFYDSNSEMPILDAKSINDIDSALLHVSENTGGGIEETENRMLVMKAESLEDMESVFKQVDEVLGENSNTVFGNTGFGDETESGMLVLKAKSVEDIDSAIKQASEIKEINGLNAEEISI